MNPIEILKDLSTVIDGKFDPLSKAYIHAADLLERYADITRTYSELSLHQLKTRSKQLLEKHKDITTLPSSTISKLSVLNKQISEQKVLRKEKREIEYQLLALYFLIRGYQRVKVLEVLKGESWIVQHHILVRWGWMGFHKQHIQEKRKSRYPYQCLAGPWSTRVTEDKEFEVLCRFLPYYQQQTQQFYLYHKRPAQRHSAPDFEIKNKTMAMGLEVTIAPQTKTYGKKSTDKSKFTAYLNTHFSEHLFQLTLKKVLSWHEAYKHRDAIRKCLDLIHILHTAKRLQNDTYSFDGLICRVAKQETYTKLFIVINKTNTMVFHVVHRQNWTLLEDFSYKKNRRLCVEAIIKSINRKALTHPGKKSLLVIEPNTEFEDIDYDKVVKEVKERKKELKISTQFKEIWLCTEKRALKVYPYS